MDKEEALLILQKNKIEMEYKALLQNRNVILVTLAGLPITVTSIVVTILVSQQLSGYIVYVVLFLALFFGIFNRFWEHNEVELKQKRKEVDKLIRQFKTKQLKEKG